MPLDPLGVLEKMEEVKKRMDEVKEKVGRVEKLHGDILATPVPDEGSKQELDQLMSSIQIFFRDVRGDLSIDFVDILLSVSKEEEEDASKSGVVGGGLLRTQLCAVLRQVLDLMTQYQAAQRNYRDRCKGRIKRHLEIAGGEFSDDQVEKIIQEGNFAVFTQGIIQQTEQAKAMLADIQARHNDLLKSERSIGELDELFEAVDNVVKSQVEESGDEEIGGMEAELYDPEAPEQLAQNFKLCTAAARRKKKMCVTS